MKLAKPDKDKPGKEKPARRRPNHEAGGLSIRRHVLAYMLSAVLVLFGLIAYQKSAWTVAPNIEQPVISISTTLTGATPR